MCRVVRGLAALAVAVLPALGILVAQSVAATSPPLGLPTGPTPITTAVVSTPSLPPVPTVPVPTVPVPTGPAPTVPVPTVPLPTVPTPSVPVPSVPVPTSPVPIPERPIDVGRAFDTTLVGPEPPR